MGRTLSPAYAGPTFYTSPPASALPIPNFSKRSSTVSSASSDSGSSCTKSKWVSFTSDTNSQDGERALSATQERDKSEDMEPKTTLTVSAQRSPAFEKLAERMREGNVAQVKRNTVHHQKSKILKVKQRQQAIIDRIEQVPAKVITGCTPWEMHDIRDQKSQQSQEMWHLAANNLLLLERSTNHLLQLATQRLQQDLAEQKEILQQRLNDINEQIKEEKNLAGDEMGLISSKMEDSSAGTDEDTTLVYRDIDRGKDHHQEVILPSNLSLVTQDVKSSVEDSDDLAIDDEVKSDQQMPETDESDEAEEEVEDLMEIEDLENGGYYSMEE